MTQPLVELPLRGEFRSKNPISLCAQPDSHNSFEWRLNLRWAVFFGRFGECSSVFLSRGVGSSYMVVANKNHGGSNRVTAARETKASSHPRG